MAAREVTRPSLTVERGEVVALLAVAVAAEPGCVWRKWRYCQHRVWSECRTKLRCRGRRGAALETAAAVVPEGMGALGILRSFGLHPSKHSTSRPTHPVATCEH